MTAIKDVEGMEFAASAALIIHEIQKTTDEGDFTGDSEIPTSFVTMHRIRKGEVCEGFPVTRRRLLNLFKRIQPSLKSDLPYLLENVLAYSPYNVVLLWWLPGGVRHLFFDESTGIKCGKAPIPPLLFRYNGIGLTVFALKESKRPLPETDIFYSPFYNWGCMGDVRLPEKPGPTDTKRLEDLFFRSAFTFHNPPRLQGTTGDGLWQSLVGSGKEEFPFECLVKAGKLRDLLKRGADDY